MKRTALVLALVSLSSVAFADFRPGRERAVQRAENMQITDARFMFEHVQSASLYLNATDGIAKPTSLTLQTVVVDPQTGAEQQGTQVVKIKDVRSLECNWVQYTASLGAENPMGGRFSITLIDRTKNTCDVKVDAGWEAYVRSGFGWCGTMDATMTLTGEPEHMFVTM